MAFSFYGSSVTVIGAKRGNHGDYQVTMDGSNSPQFSGKDSNNQFNATLFSSSNEKLGHHNLTITNLEDSFFDVDYVFFDTSVGTDNEELIVNTYQDNHPSFTYSPSSAWHLPSNVGFFVGGTGQCVEEIINHKNIWDAVALYGPVGPNSTNLYSVTVDNQTSSIFSPNKLFYRPQQVLYFAAGLGGGQHVLEIQAIGQTGEFAIDYATVYSAPSLGGSFLERTANSGQTSTNRVPPGAIAGLIFTTLIAVFACMLSGFLLWRQRHTLSRKYKNSKEPKQPFDIQAKPYDQPYTIPYPSHLPNPHSLSRRSSMVSQASQVLTQLTIPATMSNVGTLSMAGMTYSDFYTSGRRTTLPEEPLSSTLNTFSGSVSSGMNARSLPYPPEKNAIAMRNPTSAHQQVFDEPNAQGNYMGIRLPGDDPTSPPPMTAPPEYSQRMTMNASVAQIGQQMLLGEPGGQRLHVSNI
ncbi:hypothetical protein JR316_0001870 [Psilocybe cubensis]|nr:hypothetical protein JR316_0001870 [Psilocybe cubensis]KAH9484966.1 hypothetical protein JR316_0001870 [Psilocybe cubensis]